MVRGAKSLVPRSSVGTRRLWSSAASLVSSHWFWLVATALLTLVLYGPMLNDWFQTDDFFVLRAGRFTGPWGAVREAFDFTGYDRHAALVDFIRDDTIALPFLAYRPLTFVGFEGMYLAFGENPAGYHAVSLIVHFISIYLVWRIASRLLNGAVSAHIAALIFALHPAYVEAVSWISDVATTVATMTALLSLLLLCRAVEGARLRTGWYVGSVLSYAASMYFHLETISWIVPLTGLLLVVHSGRSRSSVDARVWLALIPFAGIAAGTFVLQSWIADHTPVQHGNYVVGGMHTLTNFKNYASISLFPSISEPGLAHFVAFVGLLTIMTLLPALTWLLKADVARPKADLVVIAWYVASIAPLLTATFTTSSLAAIDRKLYTAGPSLAILLVMFGTALLSLVPGTMLSAARTATAGLLVMALVGGLAIGTEHRHDFTEGAQRSEQFVHALRTAHPELEEGSTLYVVDAPLVMRVFGDVYLVGAVKAFYGKVDVYAVSAEQADKLEGSLDDRDRIFRYRRNP